MLRSKTRVQVFGPAYLDRVVLVDRALVSSGRPSLDQSVDGEFTFGPRLILRDPTGAALGIETPADWDGPTGSISLSRPVGIETLSARAISCHDDLGGMGAGYASALGGELVTVLGPVDDPTSRYVTARLDGAGVSHRALRATTQPADWTLVITSGPNGDKLPVGFRGCLDQIETLEPAVRECDLRVVASFPNRLAAPLVRGAGARLKLFAPTTRNMTDREVPVSRFAEWVDILCCNRREWESLEDREQVAWQVSILAVTDGPSGSVVRFTTPQGEAGRIELPAFPRSHPPRDTNRAGEAYGAALAAALLDAGWSDGVAEPSLIRFAAERASAAAALVLDRAEFGFPTVAEIDEAVRVRRVERPTGGEEVDPRYNARVERGMA